VSWEAVALTGPAAELVREDARPTVVLFFSPDEQAMNRLLDTSWKFEPIALALLKFRCVRVDVDRMDERARKSIATTPAVHVYAPDASCLGQIEGRDCCIDGTTRLIKRAWGKLFTLSQSTFVRRMTKILDKTAYLEKQPKTPKVEKSLEQLREQETALLARCKLKSTWGAAASTSAVKAFSSIEKALAEAEKTGRNVVVEYYAASCNFCRQMDRKAYADPRVQKALGKDVVYVRLHQDKNAGEFEKRWGRKGTPTFVVLKPDGTQIGKSLTGIISASEFLKYLAWAKSGQGNQPEIKTGGS
jgi:thioredoxin-related protein